MSKNVFCTIMTPTYNRADFLPTLYKSLKKQSDKDFEWIIVDDGSQDNTEDVVKKFINETKNFKIIYHKSKNGGKHRAVNKGIDLAHGKIFAIVDSDDYLTVDALKKIKEYFKDIEKNSNKLKYAGVAGMKGYSEKEITGKTFKGKYVDAKSTERRKYNISGDKFEVFYTSVLKKNKFPEIKGEKFMTEAILWTRLANLGYYIRWYNDIIYICEYLPGGLTDKRKSLIDNSPKGYALYIKEQVKFGNITIKQKLGYYSFYAEVRKKYIKYSDIAKELDTNKFLVIFSVCLRKILGR